MADTDGRNNELEKASILGVIWLMGQSVSARVIGLLAQIVLARLLFPTDFAILAMAGTVTSLIGMLVNFGIDDVLLQRQNTMRFWRTPALVVSLGLGILSAIAVIVVSPFVADAYKNPVLIPILSIMAISMPLSALSMVPNAELRAAMNFKFLTAYTSIELIVQQLMTIALAATGWGAFSFVLPTPILALVRVVVFWAKVGPRLGPMKRRQILMLSTNSSVVFGTRIITAFVGQGDYMMLGLMATKSTLGLYFFAYKLAFQPLAMLAGNISSVMFPMLASIRQDRERQGRAAMEASEMLAYTVMPLCFLQAALVPWIVPLVFGPRWDGAIVVAQVLSIALAFDAISWVAGAMLNARGEFRKSFVFSCIFSPAFFVMIYAGTVTAPGVGTAVGVLAFYLIVGPIYSWSVFKSNGIRFSVVVKLYFYPAAMCLVTIGLPYWIISSLQLNNLEHILLLGTTTLTLSYAGLTIFAPKVRAKLIERLTRTFGWAQPAGTRGG